MINQRIQIKELPTEKLCKEAAIAVLQKAFVNDPLFQMLFGKKHTHKHMTCFFSYMLKKSTLLHEKTLFIDKEEKTTCVANLELPSSKTGLQMLTSPLFLIESIALAFQLPAKVFSDLNAYMKLTTAVRPPMAHHYLTFIGVHPDYQGQGIGKHMLEHIHRLVDADSSSSGIGLDTENPKNIPLYERFGYKVTAEQTLQDMTIYSMFRDKAVS